MEKILKDRLNHLKSRFREYQNPKMDRKGQDPFIIQDFRSRIDEIRRIINKCKELDEKS